MVALPDAPVPVAVVGGVEEACAVRLQLLEEAEVRRVRTRREIALERTAVRRPGLDFPRLRLGNAHEEVDAPVVAEDVQSRNRLQCARLDLAAVAGRDVRREHLGLSAEGTIHRLRVAQLPDLLERG